MLLASSEQLVLKKNPPFLIFTFFISLFLISFFFFNLTHLFHYLYIANVQNFRKQYPDFGNYSASSISMCIDIPKGASPPPHTRLCITMSTAQYVLEIFIR